MSRARMIVGALTLSAAAFVGIVSSEGYTDRAIIPTKDDRPTVGHGCTFYENGAPARMGDTITPTRALVLAAAHLSKEESAFCASLPGAALHQAENDTNIDWTYQYSVGAWRSSSMRREVMAGNYIASCHALLRYKFAAGYDCSTPGNRRCPGVYTRQLERHKKCMEPQ